jgi:D-alanyl-D-alanine carboxypeptidase (penicillin-binding protein 5/6)
VPRNAQKPPDLTAKAVLVRDVGSGVALLEKNSDEKLPIASLTKLMTALVVIDKASLDDEVVIENSDLETPLFRLNFPSQERVTVRGLLAAMLVSSANDAAMALARHTMGSPGEFVKAMNEKARSLHMASTSFANPVGFDAPSHFSTASDLSRLVEEVLAHGVLLDIVKMKSAAVTSVSGHHKAKLYTTNRLLLEDPRVTGLKTGFTAEAGGSLIILTDKYYSIMLGSLDREQETKAVMTWVENNFVWSP